MWSGLIQGENGSLGSKMKEIYPKNANCFTLTYGNFKQATNDFITSPRGALPAKQGISGHVILLLPLPLTVWVGRSHVEREDVQEISAGTRLYSAQKL